MAQENLMAIVNTGEESGDQSRVEQASSISLYHTGQSSGILATNSNAPTSSSSLYYSTRIQSMIQNRSNFTSEVEFDIAYSRDHHWSDLVDSDTHNAATQLANHEHFRVLKNHPNGEGFFMSVKVVVGQKINEGAQVEIYDAKVEFEDGRKSPGYGYHVVKVMKGDCPLQDFQRQWPVGMLCNASKDRVKGPLMWILGGTMIGNRFAFVMLRQWGDLRKLLDLKMQQYADQFVLRMQQSRDLFPSKFQRKWPRYVPLFPPQFEVDFITEVLLCIARDMDSLHTKYGIVHRDLKAFNILLWSLNEGLPCDNPHVKANVVDYECSMGVVGSRFWRAPEILQQLKDRVPSSQVVFTKPTDVYSYGMVCYELLTGRIPFEDHSARDYEFVLNRNRPELPILRYTNFCIVDIIESCWKHEPLERPTFSDIVNILENENRREIIRVEEQEVRSKAIRDYLAH